MTRRVWWMAGVVATVAILGGGLWAHQARMPATATACASCDARHQSLTDRRGQMAKTLSDALTPPSAKDASE